MMGMQYVYINRLRLKINIMIIHRHIGHYAHYMVHTYVVDNRKFRVLKFLHKYTSPYYTYSGTSL